MDQGLVIAICVAVVAAVLCLLPARRAMARFRGPAEAEEEGAGPTRMLSETVEYRTSASTHAALAAIEERLSSAGAPGLLDADVRLTERTPACLRYAVGSKTASFLEAVVAAAPRGAGSTVTIEVVRWLERGAGPMAAENLGRMRRGIEAALRSADPGIEVLVHADD
ncbi:hypothetical protein GCM10027449_26670 [Sinomonas notoginsengisoli]|uniref:hypothetical protein n=1 Tax=Sinomonas notoginsengisoli TaxID=1457311 RepID=UPI001F26A0DF|nr:hypothetical protein [Sinomonas notoginsengisoli]